jgi:thiamine-phosphate pyrophosphorylase
MLGGLSQAACGGEASLPRRTSAMLSRTGLYPLIDLDAAAAAGVPALELTEAVLEARPALLQLRAKSQAPRETLATLRALLPRCRSAGTLLFANDRPDLALLAGADGVHVGQQDLPVAVVRRLAPHLRIGVSTHDLDQLAAALAERPDYVAYGPVFTTRSKARPDPTVGLEALARAAELARAAGCPLVAIGGIDLERAPSVAPHAAFGAVIADLFAAGRDPAAIGAHAQRLHAALGGT